MKNGDAALIDRALRTGLVLLALALFIIVPGKIVSYGFLPTDDALRHSAYAVGDRQWGDIMLLNPELRPENDGQAGWHSFLRAVHKLTGWSATRLVDFSVILAFFTFTLSGLLASGNPPSWLLACATMAILEPGMLGKLLLGRPLFFTMASVVVLTFIWMRERALPWRTEWIAVFLVLAVDVTAHSSAWYLWLIAIAPLVACQRWASLRIFVTAWIAAVAVACLVNGPYNAVVAPLLGLQMGLLQANTFRSNLVGELQPSGGPWITLLVAGIIIAVKCLRGSNLRSEIFRVDVCFVIVAWTLGLYVGRFWNEWGMPALTVWFTREIRDAFDVKASGLARPIETLAVFALAAVIFYVSLTVDNRGRYTAVLRNPMLWAPADEIERELPEDGGVLYHTDMFLFYALFHRFPDAKFKYVLAMEAGVMPPDDLRVYRDVQSTGKLEAYKPWFDKMTPKDRIVIQQATKPEWPGIEFRKFFSGWIGRKAS
jgi:hypothetical protein